MGVGCGNSHDPTLFWGYPRKNVFYWNFEIYKWNIGKSVKLFIIVITSECKK